MNEISHTSRILLQFILTRCEGKSILERSCLRFTTCYAKEPTGTFIHHNIIYGFEWRTDFLLEDLSINYEH